MDFRTNGKKSKLCAKTAPARAITNITHNLSITLFCVISILQPFSANPRSNNIRRHTSDELTNYEMIKPTLHHGRNERQIDDTRLKNGLHANEIILRYAHNDNVVIIDLKLNKDLIYEGHFMRYQLLNGTDAVQHFTKIDIDLCQYKGKIRNIPASQVALSTCYGIKGIVFDGDETYFIDPKLEGNVSDEHYLYRRSDTVDKKEIKTCGFHKNDDLDNDLSKDLQRHKRSATEPNATNAYVELVLVVDNAIYTRFGNNLTKVHKYCKDIINIVNVIYRPLDVIIALVGVVVWTERNEFEISRKSGKTLSRFLIYRKDVLLIDHPNNDVALLLTDQKYDGDILGLARIGGICTTEQSGGISATDHSSSIGLVASITIAHELGHVLGMEHDTDDCKCEEEKCVMHEEDSDVASLQWSSCSVDQLHLSFERGLTYCLWNKPTQLFGHAECGNGFVEPGEECDCGLPDYCGNFCCNPNTCMLHSNASCATGECCDLTTCHLSFEGAECRTAHGECDSPEYCTGRSEYCPQDNYNFDAELCEEGNGYCYEGACRSHDEQCKLLWGPSGHSVDACYTKNLDGEYYGNCGHDPQTHTFEQCSEEDILCGLLQCQSLDGSLQSGFGLRIFEKEIADPDGCQSVIFDRNAQYVDPGLTPNGAMCGKGKICVQQKCVSVERLRASGGPSFIPNGFIHYVSSDGSSGSSGLDAYEIYTIFLGVISLFLVT